MKILIVYYSLYGHTQKLAKAVEEGARMVAGAEVLVRRVEEFDIVVQKDGERSPHLQLREEQNKIPVCTVDDLRGRRTRSSLGSPGALWEHDGADEAAHRLNSEPVAQRRDGGETRGRVYLHGINARRHPDNINYPSHVSCGLTFGPLVRLSARPRMNRFPPCGCLGSPRAPAMVVGP